MEWERRLRGRELKVVISGVGEGGRGRGGCHCVDRSGGRGF